MNPARWQQIKRAFGHVLQLEPEQRTAYIDEIGATDPDLRERVAALLLEHDKGRDGSLGNPAVGLEIYRDLVEIDADTWLGKHIGPYQLVRELGSGGMGEVYLARRVDAEFDQQVAIKVIRGGQDSAAVISRFKNERQILAGLNHPNIAKFLDGGRTPEGQPYFVMEYVPGVPITQYCDDAHLSIRHRLEVFIHACEGVQHAHHNAIIHRDIKPSNIMVVEFDGKPVPRIIDFGLAKAITPSVSESTLLTRIGNFMGTPGYMSPEQVDANGREIDSRTDVYSLGVILYVLLTGVQPFEAQAQVRLPLDQWLRRLREDDPPPPSLVALNVTPHAAAARGVEPKKLAGQLRGDLDGITLKALERERERRYGTPSEFAADLRRYLNDEAVEAQAASAGYKIRKFVRRHRLATAVACLIAVLMTLVSVSGLMAVRGEREARRQSVEALRAQSRLLTQTAAQWLKQYDTNAAKSVILQVLTNPRFAGTITPETVSTFQDVRASDLQFAVLVGHDGAIYCVNYSSDGTRIVTSSDDNTARVWDARTGLPLAVLTGHGGFVATADFSPDGTRIVTASWDKTARIWDARSGALIRVLNGHDGFVSSADFSPDGSRIVTASVDTTAAIWDANTGARLATLTGHHGPVRYATYSPDGTRVVTASGDGSGRVWNARTGVQLAQLSGHVAPLLTARYSPDGTRVVTASTDKTVRIWDARTGSQLLTLSGRTGIAHSAMFSPDGMYILSALADNTARISDASSGDLITVLSGHAGRVLHAAYSPDGARVVTGSADKTARIWNLRQGTPSLVMRGHTGPVMSAAYSVDGQHVLTASWDNTARSWDAASGAPSSVRFNQSDYVYSASFSPDGTRILTGSNDTTTRMFETITGTQLAKLTGHAGPVHTAEFSPDGSQLLTASFDKTARLWDASTGTPLRVLSGHKNYVMSAAYSPDGTRVVTASWDKTARIWDVASGAQLAVLYGHDEAVNSAAYSPNGDRIVTASMDRTARVWDARTGASLVQLSGHLDGVDSAAFSPDGNRIVTGSHDATARIWDARTGTQLRVLTGHLDRVSSVTYSADGRHVLTASMDRTARIWDAQVPAALDAQVAWFRATETDALPETMLVHLGLAQSANSNDSSAPATSCDQASAAIYDPDRTSPGAILDASTADAAASACAAEFSEPQHDARVEYQLGRIRVAQRDFTSAKLLLETAVSKGYRAAQIDLGNLLMEPSAKLLDPAQAVLLYRHAWQDGVAIAAFELGRVYEHGLPSSSGNETAAFSSDPETGWRWYQNGADAHEPHALARFAERDERDALDEPDATKRRSRLLQAFTLYATAAERATREEWPQNASQNWRYRRATIAWGLANEGMMQQVAEAYEAVVNPARSTR